MKYYDGVSEDDRTKKGRSYVNENESGGECFNFQDYNGKCYGFVRLNGEMNLETHFKGVRKSQDFINELLIVWVATNDTNETKIVGWYKNATIYRTEQHQPAFTDEQYDLYYNIVADAKDCYLLLEEERTFQIQRAAQTGKGTGMGRANVWYAESSFAQTVLIPEAIHYINNYNGKYANLIVTDEIVSEIINGSKLANDYQELYDEGEKYFEEGKYISALKFFNTARLIKETPDVLFYIGDCLLCLLSFDRAIPFLKRLLNLGGIK